MKSDVKIQGDRLIITRTFDAPRERVFDAWRQTETVQKWWGCKNTSKVQSKIDFSAGRRIQPSDED
jgi:uncharacterized protein YndB with AHSA1/START domain